MAGTFNQSLQCTQDVFVGFQAPSPPVFESAPMRTSEQSWIRNGTLTEMLRYLSLVEGTRRARLYEGKKHRPFSAPTPPLQAGSSTCPKHHLPRLFSLKTCTHMCADLPGLGSSNGLGFDLSLLYSCSIFLQPGTNRDQATDIESASSC